MDELPRPAVHLLHGDILRESRTDPTAHERRELGVRGSVHVPRLPPVPVASELVSDVIPTDSAFHTSSKCRPINVLDSSAGLQDQTPDAPQGTV